jgi:TolB-like protein
MWIEPRPISCRGPRNWDRMKSIPKGFSDFYTFHGTSKKAIVPGFIPMIGTSLAHYRITAAIGAGGMGEVFRATDTKLGREVALKVLPAEMATSPERLERFRREARAVAALNHPHIVTIHSVEEDAGVHFLTMELVEGEPLDRLIPASGLPLDRILKIATTLSEALAAAHDKGIVHRDLKPANVMVTKEGHVKILDFGLAKISAPEASSGSVLSTEAHTREGVVMGTVPYMSPEQISGRTVDQRTDIYSLGVILYEMATGQRPYHGNSSAELISSILRDTPRPLAELRADLPDGLARVIARCLEKIPAERIPSARALREVLGMVSSVPSPIQTAVPAASRPVSAVDSTAIRADEGFGVAVLPFQYTGVNADLTTLAEGLSEEIITGLSRFSYLRVIARSSTQQYSAKAMDVRSVGQELGARYVMQGSLRQAGSMLRVAVQLVDATTGAHLWAETYDRPFSPEAVFELQDDLVPRIVSTVADMHGILPRSMSEIVRLKAPDQLTPYEALLHSFGYNERFTPEALAEARTCLERAVEQSPGNADCCAMLSLMYSNEYGHWDIRNPESFEKALQFARTAVLAAPLHSLPYYALAQALFFQREFPASRTAAERAVSLNPMDGATAAFMGLLIAYSGHWDRGCALAEKGLKLNPNLPGMYNYTAWHEAYARKDYRRALDLALRLNTPNNFYQHAVLAMCYAQLGEMDAAHKSLQDMLAIKPDYGKVARQLHGKWIQPDLVEQLMDGLRKAGLEIADAERHAGSATVSISSGEQRADEGFWVAVLPFKSTGTSTELRAMAEGLTEDIVIGLSRFSYLRVIARSSTTRIAGDATDVPAIGKELGARYVMEGNLRQAGSMLRTTVQLLDAITGVYLWAETYDHSYRPEEIFALQDELVPRIVSTVADMNGVLPRSMSAAVRDRDPRTLSPFEAVLRSLGYLERITPEELEAARSALESATQRAPAHADAWAMLAFLCVQDYGQGFDLRPDALATGLAAARRAVEVAPSNPLANWSLAQALFFHKEYQSFRNAADRAAALNPMDGNSIAFLGEMLTYAGDTKRGLELAARAKQLNPNHPGWYWYTDCYDAYRRGDFRGALHYALKVNLPNHWFWYAAQAAACGQLGDLDAAAKAVQGLLRLRPGFPTTARQDIEKWWNPDYVEKMLEGWRKAGLEIESADTQTR